MNIASDLFALLNSTESQITAALWLLGISGFGAALWIADQLFAPISVMAYGIVGFFGKRGAGKSYGMVTYCRRWRHFNKNKPVFTNLEKLNLPGYTGACRCIHIHVDVPLEEQLSTDPHYACRYKLNKCKAVHLSCSFAQIEACREGLVAIDEAGIFISSLNFVDRKNRQFARWLVGTRHYKVMVLLTAHTPGTVNNRLRDVIDQFILMEAFTTIKIFKGLVYDSGAAFGREGKQSKTIYIPMWWTTSRSYNTDSLRVQAEGQNADVIGEDFDIPGLGEAAAARADGISRVTTENQTTTTAVDDAAMISAMRGENGHSGNLGIVSHAIRATSPTSTVNSLLGNPNLDLLDASILNAVVTQTAETWNGREKRPIRAISRPGGKRATTR